MGSAPRAFALATTQGHTWCHFCAWNFALSVSSGGLGKYPESPRWAVADQTELFGFFGSSPTSFRFGLTWLSNIQYPNSVFNTLPWAAFLPMAPAPHTRFTYTLEQNVRVLGFSSLEQTLRLEIFSKPMWANPQLDLHRRLTPRDCAVIRAKLPPICFWVCGSARSYRF